jgi:hypothetical protein
MKSLFSLTLNAQGLPRRLILFSLFRVAGDEYEMS